MPLGGRWSSRPPRPGPGGDGRGRSARRPSPLPDRTGQGPPGRRRHLGACADFEAAIAADPAGRLARAARLDRARLFAEAGAPRRARAEYDALLDTRPIRSDRAAGPARLAMRQGRAAEAEADLTRLLNDEADLAPKARADWLASRALARLSAGSHRRGRGRRRGGFAARSQPESRQDSGPRGAGRGSSDRRPPAPTRRDRRLACRRAVPRGRPPRGDRSPPAGHDRPGGTDRRRGASCPRRDVQCPGRTRRRGLRGGSGRRSSPIGRVVCPPRRGPTPCGRPFRGPVRCRARPGLRPR